MYWCASFVSVSILALATTAGPAAAGGEAPLPERAAAGLRKASQFFLEKVAVEGGYLWVYSADLRRREGEGKAMETTVWVQPPGTPSVGQAFLGAFESTGDRFYLEAARKAAMCLVRGQLHSGGWPYRIDFDPKRRARTAYRVDGPLSTDAKIQNVSTLDDDNTQSALRLLFRVDEALRFEDRAIHEAAQFGLEKLLAAQYANGAWPQRFSGPAPQTPVKRAEYPREWSKTFPSAAYGSWYTLNDNVLADAIDTLLLAAKTYRQDRYRAAALRCGDFLLLAQMPSPQPAWAQQYDFDMHPAWARKFEPPAVTGGESHGAMRILVRLFHETGDRKYLEPIPRAIAYLRASQLPDGRLARFYELKTNRPLYFTKDYQLTYSDADTPTHYAFKVPSALDAVERQYQQALQTSSAGAAAPAAKRRRSKSQEAEVAKVLKALDDQGRWLQPGRLRTEPSATDEPILMTTTFIRNVRILSKYLAATRSN